MSISYRQLLDAAIEHVQLLKNQGVRFVAVSPETLTALQRPVVRKAVVAGKPLNAPEKPKAPAAAPAPVAAPATAPAPRVAPAPLSQVQTAPATPPQPAVARPMSREEREAAMANLRETALGCVKCPHLASSRQTVVFSTGDMFSSLMLVGEAPGADEDLQGEPFVGAAGQLLTKIIQAMGFTRQNVFIANVLKCRPDMPGQAFGNRKPTPEEMATCLPYLEEQIRLVQPKLIVALGSTAMQGLFGKPVTISRLRGHWQELRGIPVMPTYHPSYLLHNQAVSEKRKVWEDMLLVMERLQVPISQKQRNFFLKG